MILFQYLYKVFKYFISILRKLQWIIVYIKFKLNNIHFKTDFKSNGIPIVSISLKSKVSIGYSFMMNNGKYHNMIGRQQPCYFVVRKGAELIIGNNVGISATTIVCWQKIVIEDNVRIGGGTVIYDTDFHSLISSDRLTIEEDFNKIRKIPVLIKTGAFIGANCTILKGVTIGQNSIIGACSVVTKCVPKNEVWGGNPAKYIRKILPNE